MRQREDYLRRLGELELERADITEKMEKLRSQLNSNATEYAAIRSILSSSPPDKRLGSQGTPLIDIIYNTLKTAHRPMHYREILEILESESFHMYGSAIIQNLSVRLKRDPRFVKTEKGVYGLSDWAKESGESNTQSDNRTEITSRPVQGLTVSEKRELEKTRFYLEAIGIDIQVTKNNMKALRDNLLGRTSKYKLPENIDPKVASISFEKKLIKLLEQKKQLENKLNALASRDSSGT